MTGQDVGRANSDTRRSSLPAETYRQIDPARLFDPGRIDSSAMFDTLLEVFDMETGRLLASQRHADAMRMVRGSTEYVHTVRELEDGHIAVRILRVDFLRQ